MTQLLFHSSQDNVDELEAARRVGWDVAYRVTRLRPGGVTIGRYSVLPNYRRRYDCSVDVDAPLIHTPPQHAYIAEMRWLSVLRDLTPKTFFDRGYANVPDCEHGYVVKGRTNSRKFRWNTHMYAPDREALRDVMRRCHEDRLLSGQGLVIRAYEPLETFETGINGLPITDEWRLFYWGPELVAGGYYWAQAEHIPEGPVPAGARALADEAAQRLAEAGLTFFVVDVARRANSDDWIVVEVNSGQMSGLSCIDPDEFYSRLLVVAPKYP